RPEIGGDGFDVVALRLTLDAREAMRAHIRCDEAVAGLHEPVSDAGQNPIEMVLGHAMRGDDRRAGTHVDIVQMRVAALNVGHGRSYRVGAAAGLRCRVQNNSHPSRSCAGMATWPPGLMCIVFWLEPKALKSSTADSRLTNSSSHWIT